MLSIIILYFVIGALIFAIVFLGWEIEDLSQKIIKLECEFLTTEIQQEKSEELKNV